MAVAYGDPGYPTQGPIVEDVELVGLYSAAVENHRKNRQPQKITTSFQLTGGYIRLRYKDN